jgi:hypothetical protein
MFLLLWPHPVMLDVQTCMSACMQVWLQHNCATDRCMLAPYGVFRQILNHVTVTVTVTVYVGA